jgi:hypothetical protein
MMIDALGTRLPSLGRWSRDLLGPLSSSDSEAEEEADEVGDAAPVEMAGLGCGDVAVAEGLNDAITPVKGEMPENEILYSKSCRRAGRRSSWMEERVEIRGGKGLVNDWKAEKGRLSEEEKIAVDQEVLINSCNISLISLVQLEMFEVEYCRLVK